MTKILLAISAFMLILYLLHEFVYMPIINDYKEISYNLTATITELQS